MRREHSVYFYCSPRLTTCHSSALWTFWIVEQRVIWHCSILRIRLSYFAWNARERRYERDEEFYFSGKTFHFNVLDIRSEFSASLPVPIEGSSSIQDGIITAKPRSFRSTNPCFCLDVWKPYLRCYGTLLSVTTSIPPLQVPRPLPRITLVFAALSDFQCAELNAVHSSSIRCSLNYSK